MKTLILALTLIWTFSVWAADEEIPKSDDVAPKPFAVPDSLGTFSMDFKDIGEPSYSPYEMTLTVKCKNKTKKITLINKESICGFNEYSHDEKTHTILIIYRTAEIMSVEAECNTKWAQAWKLKEICGK